MKLSQGRGIQFFKKPNLTSSKSFIVNTFTAGKKQLGVAFASIGKTFTKQGKAKKGEKK